MEFFKKEYPDTDVAVDVTYASFGDRLRAIRKERRDVPGRVCSDAGDLQAGPQPLRDRAAHPEDHPGAGVRKEAERVRRLPDGGFRGGDGLQFPCAPKDHPPFIKFSWM